MAGWTRQKRESFEKGFYSFLNSCFINSKNTGFTCLGENLYDGQRRFITAVLDGLEQDKHKFFCLKSRQLGLSTISRALSIFYIGIHRGLGGALVFDSSENRETARAELEAMIDDLPAKLKFPAVKSTNRQGITLINKSRILFKAAGVKKTAQSGGLGRSVGLSMAHLCMAPDTPVIISDGRIVRIKDVTVGDKILTHNGHESFVIANTSKVNFSPMIKIRPWLGQAIVCTPEHKIPTARGLLPAAQLRSDDLLIMPVRKITADVAESVIPDLKAAQRATRKNTTSAPAGTRILINEELGFAVGYYLAEGSITYQRRDEKYYDCPSGIIFSRHRSERAFADRAVAALRAYTTGGRTTTDSKKSLTTTENVYGAPIARWMKYNFGSEDSKHIPDTVFTWGADFCRGLLAGLLSGDGSKSATVANGKYQINTMYLSTTRASIAMQSRDLACSLGFGWAACDYRGAGQYYGRNCKAIWTVRWGGTGAGGLRELIGLAGAKKTRAYTNKYQVLGDKVFIKIKSITGEQVAPYVCDLAIAHADHTFRTPWMAVSNSELCSFSDPEGLESFENSLSDENPDRLYIYESTARGFNLWHTIWTEARKDTAHCVCIFLGWWSHPKQRIERDHPDFELYGRTPPTPTEEKKIKQVRELYDFEVTMEALAWIRRRMNPAAVGEGDADPEFEGSNLKIQENPWTEEEAFQQTGSIFFSAEKLTEMTNNFVNPNFNSYMYSVGAEFHNTIILKAPTVKMAELKVWEEPDPEGYYVLGIDPAFGENETNDRSSIQVCRCYANGIDQVAEYASPLIKTDQLAYVIASLMGWYGKGTNAQVKYALELNGPGTAVFQSLRSLRHQLESHSYLEQAIQEQGLKDVFRNVRTYLYSRVDSMQGGAAYHIKTTAALKITFMERLRDFVSNGMFRIRSMDLVGEMKSIAREGDTIKAPGSMKDDRVLAAAFAINCWETGPKRLLMAASRTRETEVARQRLTITDQVNLYQQNQLQYFFSRKARDRMAGQREQTRRSWRGW